MSLITYGSDVINGQLVPVFQKQALSSGNAVGPMYGGTGASPQTIPPGANQSASSGTAGAAAAGGAPWDPRVSPLPVLIVMLLVGVLGLRFIHWRD